MISTSTALQKPELLKIGKFQLVSPIVHIGSEVSKLNPFEYVATSSRVYFPDREALGQVLQKRGKLTEYIHRIEQREDITSLLEDTFGENWLEITTEEGNPVFPDHRSSRRWTQERITDLRPMIRNGFGQLYIPGSSIKGAIRTAIAYYLLKYAKTLNVPQEKRVSSIETQLRQNLGDLKYRAKFVDDNLFMDELFANYGLTYQGRSVRVQERPNPNTDDHAG
ncbi:MAG: type III-A CRISPR-associated RAMP protein Csm5 [Coleofasciculaceae cyanobacterium SM2_1_6]|nr:type III-A CRISPR-associated RAMP protein Csm5 [Coleofasciculaceae cyanobacterium SM2_1_6]